MAFIVVMILSLAAVGLAPGIGSTSRTSHAPDVDDDQPLVEETPTGLQTFEGPEKTIDPAKGYKAVISTDQGDIVVALSANAPQAANSFAYLAGQNFYDGLQFYWVLPEFDAQAGDPTCAASGEVSCTGSGGPGYTLPLEGEDTQGKQWAVIAPATSPGSETVHGSQFVVSLTDDAFEGSMFGEVVEGQDILESLARRVPCFGSSPSDANPCQTEDELPPPLTIEDVVVQPT